ncbi:hypothetical protein ACFQ7O_26135 [Streptomyces sp. NPDC056485]|uniref:hypothetical protein n=1 Tax=Streptomyces sp. NPDC056485 TaxID=3345834 RepID=UPI0036C57D7F
MRMRLRPALHYAPVRDGVYFGAEGTSFVLRGPAALFKVTDVCVPLLEDGASEDSLVAALGGEAARPVVAKLLEAWRRAGLLLDLDALSVPEPDAGTRERHRDVLADLEMLHDDPYAAFERLRAATVLVSGPAASVLPAARGLARTGVGRLVLAVPDADADAVADTADRLGARRLPLTAAGVEVEADAAIVFAPGELLDGAVARQAALLPPGCAIVPVREDGRFHLVGPQTTGAAGRPEAVAARVAGWVKTPDAAGAPLGAAAGALAGALAGQLAYRVLTGTAGVPGETAYVVHGAELNATRVDLAPAGPAGPAGLADTPAAADLDEAVAHVQAVGAKWTGPFELVTPENLPQLPLGIAEAEHRDGRRGSVAAWGGNQRSSSVSVALAALRAQVATADGTVASGPADGTVASGPADGTVASGPADGTVAAAGTTEERWLLDGTLRLLAAQAEPAGDAPAFEDLDKAAQVLWRTLEDHEFLEVELRLSRVPGLDWPLALVRDRATGQDVASAWGPGPARAAVAALSTALARVQTRRVRGRELVAAGSDTTALLHATDAEAAVLAAQTRLRLVPHGERAADPVLGRIPLWYGAVTGLPAAVAPVAPADIDALPKEAVA